MLLFLTHMGTCLKANDRIEVYKNKRAKDTIVFWLSLLMSVCESLIMYECMINMIIYLLDGIIQVSWTSQKSLS